MNIAFRCMAHTYKIPGCVLSITHEFIYYDHLHFHLISFLASWRLNLQIFISLTCELNMEAVVVYTLNWKMSIHNENVACCFQKFLSLCSYIRCYAIIPTVIVQWCQNPSEPLWKYLHSFASYLHSEKLYIHSMTRKAVLMDLCTQNDKGWKAVALKQSICRKSLRDREVQMFFSCEDVG